MPGEHGLGPELQVRSMLEGRCAERDQHNRVRSKDLLGLHPGQILQPVTSDIHVIPMRPLFRPGNRNRKRKHDGDRSPIRILFWHGTSGATVHY
jgi:hypothetical protein